MTTYDRTIDSDVFPEPGTEHRLLIWYANFEIPGRSRPQTVVTFLEGPGEWYRGIENLDLEYASVPDTLPDGLYVARFRVDYDAAPYEPIEQVVLTLLEAQRVPTPSREDLRSNGWAFAPSVRA